MKGTTVQFQLTISLDNAEAADENGTALERYLAQVGARARNGYTDGKVRDGNGNTIGDWKVTDQG